MILCYKTRTYSDFWIFLWVLGAIWSRGTAPRSRAFAHKFSFQLVYYISITLKITHHPPSPNNIPHQPPFITLSSETYSTHQINIYNISLNYAKLDICRPRPPTRPHPLRIPTRNGAHHTTPIHQQSHRQQQRCHHQSHQLLPRPRSTPHRVESSRSQSLRASNQNTAESRSALDYQSHRSGRQVSLQDKVKKRKHYPYCAHRCQGGSYSQAIRYPSNQSEPNRSQHYYHVR